MAIYKIAELTIHMNPTYTKLITQAKKYEIEDRDKIDISIELSTEYIEKKHLEQPHLTSEDCEYIWYGADFCNKLLDYNGMVLHSSCIMLNNEAYLFSAPCGVGKSTHTALWQTYFGKDKAVIINDDKPVLRLMKDGFYAYGTPFSGKTDLNINAKVKVKAIIFIEQDKDNHIERMDEKSAINCILNQTLRPKNKEKYIKLLQLMDQLIGQIPIYTLGCTISTDAVQLVYNTIKEDTHENI